MSTTYRSITKQTVMGVLADSTLPVSERNRIYNCIGVAAVRHWGSSKAAPVWWIKAETLRRAIKSALGNTKRCKRCSCVLRLRNKEAGRGNWFPSYKQAHIFYCMTCNSEIANGTAVLPKIKHRIYMRNLYHRNKEKRSCPENTSRGRATSSAISRKTSNSSKAARSRRKRPTLKTARSVAR